MVKPVLLDLLFSQYIDHFKKVALKIKGGLFPEKLKRNSNGTWQSGFNRDDNVRKGWILTHCYAYS